MSALKAYMVGDDDVYAAHSAEEAVRLFRLDVDWGDGDIDIDVSELTDAELDREYPEFDENERPTGNTITMRKYLAEMTAPGWLAGSSW